MLLTKKHLIYKGRLRMPRAYAPGMKTNCFHGGATWWTDYGRMNWTRKPAYRVALNQAAPKPPLSNRGVSQCTLKEWQCCNCNENQNWWISSSYWYELYLCHKCMATDAIPF